MKSKAASSFFVIAFLIMSCKKDINPPPVKDNAKIIESLLKRDYLIAKEYVRLISEQHQTQGMNMTDYICSFYDSLYHVEDSAFTVHFHQYCLEMMIKKRMGSNGSQGDSGRNNCNLDSIMVVVDLLPGFNTYRTDSIMMLHITNCLAMGGIPESIQILYDKMQTLRNEHKSIYNNIKSFKGEI